MSDAENPIELSGEDSDEVACEVCGKSDGDERLFVLCERCVEGGTHTFCAGMARPPTESEEWLCRECKDLRANDPLVNRTALVTATFTSGRFVGEVVDVRWDFAEEGDDTPGPRGGSKIHSLFFTSDGTQSWHDLERRQCDEEVLREDGRRTAERRKSDPLLRGKGAKVSIYHGHCVRNVQAGWFRGRVLDVRVVVRGGEEWALHKVHFESGDTRWRNLGDCGPERSKWEELDRKASLPAPSKSAHAAGGGGSGGGGGGGGGGGSGGDGGGGGGGGSAASRAAASASALARLAEQKRRQASDGAEAEARVGGKPEASRKRPAPGRSSDSSSSTEEGAEGAEEAEEEEEGAGAGGEAAPRAAGGRRGHSRSLLERALRTASASLGSGEQEALAGPWAGVVPAVSAAVEAALHEEHEQARGRLPFSRALSPCPPRTPSLPEQLLSQLFPPASSLSLARAACVSQGSVYGKQLRLLCANIGRNPSLLSKLLSGAPRHFRGTPTLFRGATARSACPRLSFHSSAGELSTARLVRMAQHELAPDDLKEMRAVARQRSFDQAVAQRAGEEERRFVSRNGSMVELERERGEDGE